MSKSLIKTILKLIFAPFFWLVQGCSPLGDPVNEKLSENHYYNNSKTKIIYSPMGNWFELGKTELNADINSFEVLNGSFSKDQNHVYYESFAIEDLEVDIASFYAKTDTYLINYGFDKNNVYVLEKDYKDGKGFARATIIKTADPKSFTKQGFNWGKDSQNHFYHDHPIAVDYRSFKNLHDYFSKDDHNVYMHYSRSFERIVADASTFNILDSSDYAYDQYNLYHLSFEKDGKSTPRLLTIKHHGIESIKLYNSYYLHSGNNIYYQGLKLEDAEKEKFEVISDRYGKDEKHVFFEEKKVEGADVKSFQILDDGLTVYDKYGTYRDGKLFVRNNTN